MKECNRTGRDELPAGGALRVVMVGNATPVMDPVRNVTALVMGQNTPPDQIPLVIMYIVLGLIPAM